MYQHATGFRSATRRAIQANARTFERFLKHYGADGIQLSYSRNGGSVNVDAHGEPAWLERFQRAASTVMLRLF